MRFRCATRGVGIEPTSGRGERSVAGSRVAFAGLLACALLGALPAVSCRASSPHRRDGFGADCLCAASAASAASAAPEAPAPVAAPVLAWLSKARSLHHAADMAEDADQPDRAIAMLQTLTRGPRPPARAPEIDEVLADTHARLADLQSRREAFDAALASVAEGLKFAHEASYFRGHLFEVEGLVHERRARVFADAGHATSAEHARSEAIRASMAAVRVQDDVIRRTTGADAGPAYPERDR